MSNFESTTLFTLTNNFKVESEELFSDDLISSHSHDKNLQTIKNETMPGACDENPGQDHDVTHHNFLKLKSPEENFIQSASHLPVSLLIPKPETLPEHVDYSSLIQRNLGDDIEVEVEIDSKDPLDDEENFPAPEDPNPCPTIHHQVSTTSSVSQSPTIASSATKPTKYTRKGQIHNGDCRICKLSFSTTKEYEHHFSIHSGENPYACETCGTSFSLKRDWTYHMIDHKRRSQNVTYAARYRQKKEQEAAKVKEAEDIIEKENEVLQSECNDLRRQIILVKQLIREVFMSKKSKKADVESESKDRLSSTDRNNDSDEFPVPEKFQKICRICKLNFATRQEYEQHFAIHLGNKPYKCEICGKEFICQSAWEPHKTLHTGTDETRFICICERCGHDFWNKSAYTVHTRKTIYSCEICGQRFRVNAELTLHKRVHAGEKPYECETCGKSFREKSTLKTHMRLHTGEKPYSCETCGKCFSFKSTWKAHMTLHTGETPFKCETCGQSFRLKVQLIAHMSVHTGEELNKCEICGKSYVTIFGLQKHRLVHTGEKPFKCETCGKSFRQKTTLESHMRLHTGEKPYNCGTCGKCFRFKSRWKSHMTLHTGETPFKCETCGQDFRLKPQLIAHMSVHTGEELNKCETCGKSFVTIFGLQKHRLVHTGEKPYKCETCGQGFREKSTLKTHERRHTGEKPYSCETCEKSFAVSSALKSHMRSRVHTDRLKWHDSLTNQKNQHAGEGPNKCETCGISFREKSTLTKHVMLQHTVQVHQFEGSEIPHELHKVCDKAEVKFVDYSLVSSIIKSEHSDGSLSLKPEHVDHVSTIRRNLKHETEEEEGNDDPLNCDRLTVERQIWEGSNLPLDDF